MINIPQISSIGTAVELYYSRVALSNADITALFAPIGKDKVIGLKRLAREKTAELGKMQWSNQTVRTDDAYLAWGLDIEKLEEKYKKLKRLGLLPTVQEATA